MRSIFIFVFVLTAQVLFAQCHDDDIAIIRSYRNSSNQAIAKHDVNGISQFWLDDFIQVIGRGTYESGKKNIIASWQALFNSNQQVVYVRIPEKIIVSDNDTMAWENGKWTGSHTYSKGGNYAAMWIKRNGIWMLKAELYVSLKPEKQQQ